MTPDRLSATFAALADPTRRAILARLALGETSSRNWPKPFDMSLPAVSKHLKVLERAADRARPRGAMAALPARGAAPQGVDDWLEPYRRFWEQSFDRLDDYLRELQSQGKGRRTRSQVNAGAPPVRKGASHDTARPRPDRPRAEPSLSRACSLRRAASCSTRGRDPSTSTSGTAAASSHLPYARRRAPSRRRLALYMVRPTDVRD